MKSRVTLYRAFPRSWARSYYKQCPAQTIVQHILELGTLRVALVLIHINIETATEYSIREYPGLASTAGTRYIALF